MLRFAKNCARYLLLTQLALLVACGQPPIVPLDDQSIIRTKKTEHVAGSGDTLYSIAFLSGLDYKLVAAWNNISEPYIIRRGQKINLVKPENFLEKTRAVNNNQQAISSAGGTTRAIAAESDISTLSSTTMPQVATPTPVTINPAPAAVINSNQKLAALKFDNSWKWPISAANIVNYRRSGQNSGLDIISHFGVEVKASAAGKVVYAGNGLKGYGNLIIIKHNDAYLSAYAHNRSIYVKEGDLIAQGQKIAEVGSSDANQAKLHFEIRKSGTPISPLGLLPKKVG